MIRIAELLDPKVPLDLWPLLKQVGVDEVVSLLDEGEQAIRWVRSESHLDERPASIPLPGPEGRSWSRPALELLKARYEDAGFSLVAIEDTPPMDDIRLGRAGREEQLDLFCEQLRAMGAVGVPVLCYNWIAVYSWARTGLAVPARGGALVTEYRPRRDAPGSLPTGGGPGDGGAAVGELRVLPPAGSARRRGGRCAARAPS